MTRVFNQNALLRNNLTCSAKCAVFTGKVLELWQPVFYRQNNRLIVDVHTGHKFQIRHSPWKYVKHFKCRVVDHQMSTALRAVLPIAQATRCLAESCQVLFASNNFYTLIPPYSECMEWIWRQSTVTGFDIRFSAQHNILHRILYDVL